MPLKIAMIGAGSVGFTRRLMTDLLTVPEFADTHFALMDISQRNLSMVAQLCQRDISANGLPATISSTLDRREAITDADYIWLISLVMALRGQERAIPFANKIVGRLLGEDRKAKTVGVDG